MNRHWAVTLGEVVDPVQTWNPQKAISGTFDYIDLSAVDQESKAITASTKIEVSAAPSRARQIVRTDDILVSTVRPNLNAVARVPERFDGATASTGFCVLRPSRAKADPGYVFHWVRSPEFVADMVRNATGASYPAVSDRIIKNSVFQFPTLDEQRRIATILDKADAMRLKRKRAIALLDTLTASMFLDMFGSGSDHNYAVVDLSEVTTQITDGAHFTPTYVSNGVPFLRVTDIHSAQVDWSSVKYIPQSEHDELIKRCKPEIGDILLSKNGTIGIPKVIDWQQDFSIFVSLALLKIRKDRATAGYVYSFLKSPLAEQQLRQSSKTGTVTNLHLTDIRRLKLPLPPRELQQDWDLTAGRLTSTRQKLVMALTNLESLFTSLQHRAFSGQL